MFTAIPRTSSHTLYNFSLLLQLSSLSKHRDDQDTKEANTLQFKNLIEARYFMFPVLKPLFGLILKGYPQHTLLKVNFIYIYNIT